MPLLPIEDVDELVTTRRSWHTLAERVLAPARHAATGRIGLRPTPGGVGTPPFGEEQTELRIEHTDLVVASRGRTRRAPITTLGAAAALAGTSPEAETGVYHPTTPADPDAPLPVETASATILAEWFSFAAALLDEWRAERTARDARDAPVAPQLWPEHFDLALDAGREGHRANYGASPGDGSDPEPYLYVGPWIPLEGEYWTHGTYAALPYSELIAAPDPLALALAHFRTGRRLVDEAPD